MNATCMFVHVLNENIQPIDFFADVNSLWGEVDRRDYFPRKTLKCQIGISRFIPSWHTAQLEIAHFWLSNKTVRKEIIAQWSWNEITLGVENDSSQNPKITGPLYAIFCSSKVLNGEKWSVSFDYVLHESYLTMKVILSSLKVYSEVYQKIGV